MQPDLKEKAMSKPYFGVNMTFADEKMKRKIKQGRLAPVF